MLTDSPSEQKKITKNTVVSKYPVPLEIEHNVLRLLFLFRLNSW